MDFHEILSRFGDKTHQNWVGNLKKWKPYSSSHNYSLPLLPDVTAFNTKNGTFQSQTTPKSVYKGHGKVLPDLNVGSSTSAIQVCSHYSAVCIIKTIF